MLRNPIRPAPAFISGRRPVFADGKGHDAHQFEHQVGGGNRGNPGRVVTRRHFRYVGADNINTLQGPQDDLCVAGRDPADFRNPLVEKAPKDLLSMEH